MIIPFQIYRHFKGGLYLILSIALEEDTYEPTIIYRSLNGDDKVWSRKQSDFTSLVPEGKENPTGQRNRFELVTNVRSVLSQCTTENLIKELKGRPDSPFNDYDIEGFNDQVSLRDYVIGHIVEESPSGVSYLEPVVVVDSLEEAQNFVIRHPDRCSSRTKIYKRVFVEVESFD